MWVIIPLKKPAVPMPQAWFEMSNDTSNFWLRRISLKRPQSFMFHGFRRILMNLPVKDDYLLHLSKTSINRFRLVMNSLIPSSAVFNNENTWSSNELFFTIVHFSCSAGDLSVCLFYYRILNSRMLQINTSGFRWLRYVMKVPKLHK